MEVDLGINVTLDHKMIVTLAQLNTAFEKCKTMHDECFQYTDRPDYELEHHLILFKECEVLLKQLRKMHTMYEESI